MTDYPVRGVRNRCVDAAPTWSRGAMYVCIVGGLNVAPVSVQCNRALDMAEPTSLRLEVGSTMMDACALRRRMPFRVLLASLKHRSLVTTTDRHWGLRTSRWLLSGQPYRSCCHSDPPPSRTISGTTGLSLLSCPCLFLSQVVRSGDHGLRGSAITLTAPVSGTAGPRPIRTAG